MKKHSRTKNRFVNRFTPYVRPLLAVVLVFGLAVSLMHKRSAQAASDRAKTATGIIFGGGVGATIAGVAGSAKWAPLGFGVGGLAGGLMVRAIRKRRQRRAEMEPQTKTAPRKRRYNKRHAQQESMDYFHQGPYRKQSYGQ